MALALALWAGACNQSEGSGRAWGSFDWPACPALDGDFEMEFDFLALEPFPEDAANLRMQEGGKGAEVSDGLLFCIYDLQQALETRGNSMEVRPLESARIPGEYRACSGPADSRPSWCPLVRAELYFTKRCPPDATSPDLQGSLVLNYLGFEADDRVAGSFELELADRIGGQSIGSLQGDFDFAVRLGHPYQRFPR